MSNIHGVLSSTGTLVGNLNQYGGGGPGTDNYEDLTNLPQINSVTLIGNKTLADIGIPTVNNASLTIQKNGATVGTFYANDSTNKVANIIVPTTAADVSALPSSTKYGASITVNIDSTNYKVTTTLKDQNGNTLGTAQVIDLPLESVVVNGSYDSVNKKIILTLQNGNTIDIPVGDLVSGLQTEITVNNKLDSDLVDDSGQTNKFVTASDISKLSGIETGAQVNVQANWTEASTSSDAYIQNKPTAVSAFTNDSGYQTASDVSAAIAGITAVQYDTVHEQFTQSSVVIAQFATDQEVINLFS